MNIKGILELNDFKKIIKILCKDAKNREVDKWQKEYDGLHTILDRPVKIIGKDKSRKRVEQAKLVIAYQKKIVKSAVAFLFGDVGKITLNNKEDNLQNAFKLILDVWKNNKLDYFNRKLAKRVFIESHSAELWYITPEKEIKVMLLCEENGDKIYPHFNDLGDMDAFTRSYTITDINGKQHKHTDIYMSDKIIYSTYKDNNWEVEEKPNLFKKIPIIYYSQSKPEWYDVQSEIDRLEMLISKHADTNDYYSSPMLKIYGKLEKPPEKGEIGKMLQFKEEIIEGKSIHGDANYMTWDHSPESIKLEAQNLKEIIYSITSTPDLSFNNVKGLGKVSAEALKFMLMDSILKAKNKEEIFGEGLTRRINLLKAMIGNVTNITEKKSMEELNISIAFGNIIPQDIMETIKALSTARAGDVIMSEKTAVAKNPLIENAEVENERLEEERNKLSKLGESYEA